MKRFALLFAVLALMATSAFAQNGAFAPYVSGSVATTAAMNYKNPNFTVGAGIESSTKYLLLDIHGTVATADIKTAVSNKSVANTNLSLQASGYYKFFGHFLGGGGADLATNTASLKTLKSIAAQRQSIHPFVGGGVQFGRLRSIVTYNLPGQNALTNERIFNINTEFNVTKHVRLTQSTILNSYVDNAKVRVTGNSLGAGIKFVL